MTNEQKAEIDGLRQKGLGYKKIAAKVGILENTVKSYLRRIESAPASAEKRAENPFVIERIIDPSYEGDEHEDKGDKDDMTNPEESPCQEKITLVQGEENVGAEAADLVTEEEYVGAEPADLVTEEENIGAEAADLSVGEEDGGTLDEPDTDPLSSSEAEEPDTDPFSSDAAEETASSAAIVSPNAGASPPAAFISPPSVCTSSPAALIPSPVTENRTAPCLYCGKAVSQRDGRKEKKFCSSDCRVKWWNCHKSAVPRKSSRLAQCPSCGKQFYVYGPQERKYCSQSCYITGRFAKQKETA